MVKGPVYTRRLETRNLIVSIVLSFLNTNTKPHPVCTTPPHHAQSAKILHSHKRHFSDIGDVAVADVPAGGRESTGVLSTTDKHDTNQSSGTQQGSGTAANQVKSATD